MRRFQIVRLEVLEGFERYGFGVEWDDGDAAEVTYRGPAFLIDDTYWAWLDAARRNLETFRPPPDPYHPPGPRVCLTCPHVEDLHREGREPPGRCLFCEITEDDPDTIKPCPCASFTPRPVPVARTTPRPRATVHPLRPPTSTTPPPRDT